MAYTQEEINQKFDEILNEIAAGSPAYKAMKGKLAPSTFYEILESDAEKANKYARACAQRADLIFEETLEIADETDSDIIDVEGVKVENNRLVQRDKLRVDTRKWFLSKLHPKKYGDKTEVDLNLGEKETLSKEEFLAKLSKAREKSE